jgi:hypothetical protein
MEAQMQALIMNELEGFADDLFFVPGNRDPAVLFNTDKDQLPILSSNLEANMHMAAVKLRENLIIVGLGGST